MLVATWSKYHIRNSKNHKRWYYLQAIYLNVSVLLVLFISAVFNQSSVSSYLIIIKYPQEGPRVHGGKSRISLGTKRLTLIVTIHCKPETAMLAWILTGVQPLLKSWKGPRFGSQQRGACTMRPAKGRTGCWVREGVAPFCCEGLGYHPPKIFLKTQMLNPTFWWLLAVKFLAFWKLWPRSWGTNTLLI